MSAGDGVPLVGPQEELHSPSGYTPRGFTSLPGREAKYGFPGFIRTNKQVSVLPRLKLCCDLLIENSVTGVTSGNKALQEAVHEMVA